MKNTATFFSGFVFVVVVLVTPITTSAQVITYQPRTQAEIVAYLYGRIAQLMEIKAMLERQQGGATTYVPYNTFSVDTHSALEITSTTAVLRGEVVLQNDTTATAWFEYGQDEDFLDQKTRQISIRTIYDRAVRQTVTGLEEDERYYFRIVVLNKDGSVVYGSVHGFRTDEAE